VNILNKEETVISFDHVVKSLVWRTQFNLWKTNPSFQALSNI